jgi:hypothetical protein
MEKAGDRRRPYSCCQLFADKTYLSEGERVSAQHYGFFGAIASFAAFATRNFTTVFALI